MISVRRAKQRGHANFGWLDTNHTFSFGRYQDPNHMGFRVLRVINEDRISPGKGFGTHPHDNMEIISYVLDGELEHRDSMGNGAVLRAGDLQVMSAGTGITHSEFNPSELKDTHLYQIWLLPERENIEPAYEDRTFSLKDRRGRFQLVAAPGLENGALRINQDARVYLATLEAGSKLGFELKAGRHAWVQVINGSVALNGESLDTSDGAGVSDEQKLSFVSEEGAEIMLFDLP